LLLNWVKQLGFSCEKFRRSVKQP